MMLYVLNNTVASAPCQRCACVGGRALRRAFNRGHQGKYMGTQDGSIRLRIAHSARVAHLRPAARLLQPLSVLLLFSLFGFWAPNAVAQFSGAISGTVSDSSGAIVSGANVTVKESDTGALRTTVTDSSGRYQVSSLPAGVYEVHVTKQGFSEEVRTGIHLAVGQDAVANLTLEVGEVNQQVTVNADAPLVSVTTSDASGLVGKQQIEDLPLNGRSFDQLLTLNPGIVNFTSQKVGGVGVSNSTLGNNFAVSGNRPQQNLFLLNGIEFTGAAENNMQPGSTSGELLGVDAVREFNVLRD